MPARMRMFEWRPPPSHSLPNNKGQPRVTSNTDHGPKFQVPHSIIDLAAWPNLRGRLSELQTNHSSTDDQLEVMPTETFSFAKPHNFFHRLFCVRAHLCSSFSHLYWKFASLHQQLPQVVIGSDVVLDIEQLVDLEDHGELNPILQREIKRIGVPSKFLEKWAAAHDHTMYRKWRLVASVCNTMKVFFMVCL